jgi:FkbM family methyltransferase
MIEVQDCRYGPMMYLPNDKWIGKSFHLYGEALEHEIDLIKQFVKKGDVALDLGANMGAITIPLAQAVGETGRVYAFEPQEYLYYVLCGNIALNCLYHTTAFQRPFWSSSGHLLYCPSPLLRDDKGVSLYDAKGFHYGGIYLTEESRFEHENKLETIALDDMNLDRVDFMKIDVEGAEVEVLKGAEKILERDRPIMFIETMPLTAPKITQVLRDYGYAYRSCRIRFFNQANFYQEPVDQLRESHAPESPMMSSDMICFHQDDAQKWDPVYFKAMQVHRGLMRY